MKSGIEGFRPVKQPGVHFPKGEIPGHDLTDNRARNIQ